MTWTRVLIVSAVVLCLTGSAVGAVPPSWQFYQPLSVDETGPVRVKLPPETLGTARADRADLRVLAPEDTMIPYDLHESRPDDYDVRTAGAFDVSRSDTRTGIQVVTDVSKPVDAVRLTVRQRHFFKTVTVRGSNDLTEWETLVRRAPIFARPDGPSRTRIDLPQERWKYLGLELDDRTSAPVDVQAVALGVPPGDTTPVERLGVAVTGRRQRNETSVFDLELPARHLSILRLRFFVEDPVFRRRVRLKATRPTRSDTRVVRLAAGTLYRLKDDRTANREHLSLPVNRRVHSKRLRLIVENGDNPPLSVQEVEAAVSPVHLVFWARTPGTYRILSGNPVAEAPDYDLARLDGRVRWAHVPESTPGDLRTNSDYRRPERLPEIPTRGADIDVSGWTYRKPVRVQSEGVQWLELGPKVMAHARPDLRDLRLVAGGRQVPYVLDDLVLDRRLTGDSVSVHRDENSEEGISTVTFRLPDRALPVQRLSVRVEEPLFERRVIAYETPPNRRGERRRRTLAETTWTRKPEHRSRRVHLPIRDRPKTDTLKLDIHNGNNAPLTLSDWRVEYRTRRILFKTDDTRGLALYYGNADAPRPDYDLAMVTRQLLASQGHRAFTDEEQRLEKSSWWTTEREDDTIIRIVFWGVLVVVVAGLLFVIARLLPETEDAS